MKNYAFKFVLIIVKNKNRRNRPCRAAGAVLCYRHFFLFSSFAAFEGLDNRGEVFQVFVNAVAVSSTALFGWIVFLAVIYGKLPHKGRAEDQ